MKQLIQVKIPIPTEVKNLYEEHTSKQRRPTFDGVARVLQAVAAKSSRAFIVVDALDEYQVTDGWCQKFLSALFELQRNAAVNLFLTSRTDPHIHKQLDECIMLEIRARDDDVRTYLEMSQQQLLVRGNLSLMQDVKTEIVKAVNGM